MRVKIRFGIHRKSQNDFYIRGVCDCMTDTKYSFPRRIRCLHPGERLRWYEYPNHPFPVRFVRFRRYSVPDPRCEAWGGMPGWVCFVWLPLLPSVQCGLNVLIRVQKYLAWELARISARRQLCSKRKDTSVETVVYLVFLFSLISF